MTLDRRKEVSIHPTSALFGSKADFVLFTELVQTGKTFMHLNTSIQDAKWLFEVAPEYFRKKHLMNNVTNIS